MSDGLARVAGGGVPIEFAGELIVLQPMNLRDLATVEQHLLNRRKNPMEMVKEMIPGLSVEVQKHLLELAYHDMKNSTTVPAEEVTRFLETVEGVAFSLWLVLERSHPGKFTFEKVHEIVKDMTPDQLNSTINAKSQADGTDLLGN